MTSYKGIFCNLKKVKYIYKSKVSKDIQDITWSEKSKIQNYMSRMIPLFYIWPSPHLSVLCLSLICSVPPGSLPLWTTKVGLPRWLNISWLGQWNVLAIDQRMGPETEWGVSSLWSLSSCSDGGLCSARPTAADIGRAGRETFLVLMFPPHIISNTLKYTLLTLCIILVINFWRGLYKFNNSEPENTLCILFIPVKLYCFYIKLGHSWTELQ